MKHILKSFTVVALVFFIAGCSEDSDMTGNENEVKGTLDLKLTDAPIDNANIKSCVITISDLRLDGQSVEGFTSTKVDIMAYRNGRVFDAGDFDVEAKSYSRLEFILDDEMTGDGKPGCYIEEMDGTIHALSSSDIAVELQEDFTVAESGRKELLLDFDLRKSIAANSSGSSEYRLVGSSELESAVRVTNTSNGKIMGNCNDVITGSDEIVVFAYKKGSFNRNNETSASGSSQIRFRNAVNSALCDENGNFELHFMEDGEYELHFAAYERKADGSLQIRGILQVNTLSVLSPLSLDLNGKSTVEINVIATGLIEL